MDVNPLRVVIYYYGEFGERVVGNLLNYAGFCISCGEACTQCRSGKYSGAEDIVAVFEMQDPASLGDFIDDVDPLLPEVPAADIAMVINIHPDIIFGMLPRMREAGIKGIIGCSESPKDMPLGLRMQLSSKAEELGMEAAFSKPFCAMAPDPEKPNIAAFLNRAMIGEPEIDILLQRGREGRDIIAAANVVRSAPCGSTWFVAKRLIGFEKDDPELNERISEAHHAYPCTASMEMDPEIGDTVLHKAGYIIRDKVEKAIRRAETRRSG